MHYGNPMNRLLCRLTLLCSLMLNVPVQAAQPEAAALPAPVGRVELVQPRAPSEAAMLDIGLVIFDAGIPPDESTHSKLGIFPEIRKSEAKFMPVVLRQVLLASGAWGVIRVLPEDLESSEVLLTGTILQSDGLRLVLRITARDASGRRWLDKVYVDEAAESDYPVPVDGDPYLDLYHQIANDLLSVKQRLGQKELRDIRQIGQLRYAASLSPEVFSGYLGHTADGRYTLARLPAEGDPMMARVNRIRNQEYLFIDTVDEQYATLYEEMAPTYNLWRQYGREQALYREEYQQRASSRDIHGRRGSFAAMQQTYDAYKWSKIHEQDLDELTLGFNNEVTPTVMEASGKVFRLNGTLDTQYTEWQDILRKIFILETGLTPDA